MFMYKDNKNVDWLLYGQKKIKSFSVNKNEILKEQNVTDRFDIANVIMILNF